MASEHLVSTIATPANPGALLLLGTPQGYTFGLGFLVCQADGVAGVHGTAGEFMWTGRAGTTFCAELSKEKICAVYMKQAPSPHNVALTRLNERRRFKRRRSPEAFRQQCWRRPDAVTCHSTSL